MNHTAQMKQESLFHCGLDEAVVLPVDFEGLPLEPTVGAPVLADYDRFVVFFSGGKDSIACFLHLLEQGVPVSKIELHHHLVDGRESSLMDWPVTESYCKAFAAAFGVKLTFSWKEGGFEREMLRDNAPTAPIRFFAQDGTEKVIGGVGPLGTRRRYPQVSADLSVRWCSAYLKIDVGASYLRNDPIFKDGKTLVLTGERAQESAARARYQQFEKHRADNRDGARIRRWIDAWRPVHGWDEAEVWAIMQRFGVNPHPAYHLGLSRTSCMCCIFGSPNQWALLRQFMRPRFDKIAAYESEFGVTIRKGATVSEVADKGQAWTPDPLWLAQAMDELFSQPILLAPEAWHLPAGAFGETGGPT